MNGRILYDLPRNQYDAMTDRVNWSTLKLMGESPLHYKHAIDSGPVSEEHDEDESDALLQGQAAHTAALEPEMYGGESAEPEVLDPINPPPPAHGRYLVFEGTRDERHKRYQAVLARAALGRQKILTGKQHAFAQHVGKAVRNYPPAAPYVVGGRREVTVLWDHVEPAVLDLPGWSIAMRTRIDYVTAAAALDLKTTKSAKPEEFAKQAWQLGYFHQASLHLDALKAAGEPVRAYYWIAVETRAPFAVAIYQPSRIGLELAGQAYRDYLARLRVCREEDAELKRLGLDPSPAWPGYAEGVMELAPPPWATPSEMLEAA